MPSPKITRGSNVGKGALKTVGVGRKGPKTVTPAGATQPGRQGKRSAGKK